MVIVSLRYRFRQPIRAPARAAYAWCIDFRPSDAALYGDGRSRSVRRLAPDTLIMTDTSRAKGRRVRISRLVRLNPERLAWTNTHLNGPYRHSQFWYRIVPDGSSRSHLEFLGLKLETHRHALSSAEIAQLAEANRLSDSATWRRRLAPALEAALADSSGRHGNARSAAGSRGAHPSVS